MLLLLLLLPLLPCSIDERFFLSVFYEFVPSAQQKKNKIMNEMNANRKNLSACFATRQKKKHSNKTSCLNGIAGNMFRCAHSEKLIQMWLLQVDPVTGFGPHCVER